VKLASNLKMLRDGNGKVVDLPADGITPKIELFFPEAEARVDLVLLPASEKVKTCAARDKA